MHIPPRRLVLSLFACSVLAGCAGMLGPREVALPLSKMQGALDKRFPFSNRVLDLLDIELTRPQLSVEEGSDRLLLAMDASLAPPFTHQTWQGSLILSGHLAVDPGRSGLFMDQPRVERFELSGMDPARQRQLGKVAGYVIDQLLRDKPLYSFRPGELHYGGVQFVPTRIRTSATGLLVTVEPQH